MNVAFPEAAEETLEGLDFVPCSPKFRYQRGLTIGLLRYYQRRYAEAIPLLEQYLAAQPDALAARADLGRAYVHLGQYKNAVVELTKAAEADERGDIHYQLSIALRKLGRTQEADAALKRSTEIRESRLSREQRLHANH